MNSTLIHADIFFFITTIVVIALGIVLVVLFIYLVIILKDVREISRTVRRESDEIATDVDMLRQEMRQEIRSGMSSMSAVTGFIGKLFSQHSTKRGGRHTKE
jgi:hypothetical protein